MAYIGTARRQKIRSDVGPELRCPKCNRVLAEGRVIEITLRCRKCGYWVYICDKSVDRCRDNVVDMI